MGHPGIKENEVQVWDKREYELVIPGFIICRSIYEQGLLSLHCL